jgi:hypothetical protein
MNGSLRLRILTLLLLTTLLTSSSEGADRTTRRPRRSTAPPSQLLCASDILSVSLSWRNNDRYSEIRVTRDGTLAAVLAGATRAYSESLVQGGTFAYAVAGVKSGVSSTSAACEITVQEIPPVEVPVEDIPPVENLLATADAVNNAVNLGWHNGDTYDEITVFCGGELVATLPGTATSFSFACAPWGVYEFGIQGTRGPRATGVVTCQSRGGRLAWDSGTGGSAPGGYYIYLWSLQGEPPDAGAPSYAVTSGTSVSLIDLLNAGVLPDTRAPVIFRAAVAAYNTTGTSTWCDPVDFAWQNMLGANLPR